MIFLTIISPIIFGICSHKRKKTGTVFGVFMSLGGLVNAVLLTIGIIGIYEWPKIAPFIAIYTFLWFAGCIAVSAIRKRKVFMWIMIAILLLGLAAALFMICTSGFIRI